MSHPVLGGHAQCETSQCCDKNVSTPQLQQNCHNTSDQYSKPPVYYEFNVRAQRKMCFYAK